MLCGSRASGSQSPWTAARDPAGPCGPRCLLGCLMALTRRQVSKDAELLVLRQENAALRRQINLVRDQPADRLWLAALSRLIPRRRWGEVFMVTPGDSAQVAPAAGRTHVGRPGRRPK